MLPEKGSGLMKNHAIFLLLCTIQIVVASDIDFLLDGLCCGYSRKKTIGKPTCCCCDKTMQRSHSFMYTHPLDQYTLVDQFPCLSLMFCKNSDACAAFALAAEYISSIQSTNVARYFLPSCNTNVLVSGDANIHDLNDRIIRAEWLGLPATFRGEFTLSPQQRQLGFILTYNKDLGLLFDSCFFEGMFLIVQLPIVFVENNIGFTQWDIQGVPGTCPFDLYQAFNQKAWLYGHIQNDQSRYSLSEINVKLGRAYVAEDCFLVAYYAMARFPTGNKQNPRFLFDTVVGNNGHFGFGLGVDFQLVLNRDTSRCAICFFTNLESSFFIRNHQTRSFDLIGRPWSRYLLLTDANGQVGNTTPGINILTRDVRVHLYGIANFSMGWRFKTDCLECEIGYDIWGHGNEHLELLCKFPQHWGIAGQPTDTSIFPVTASKSTIAQQAPNDMRYDAQANEFVPVFIPILESDIDMNSGAAQATINHQLHASFGLVRTGVKMDGFLGIGFFLEYPHRNAALQSVGAWFKCGSTF
jgi:hypothetical protein